MIIFCLYYTLSIFIDRHFVQSLVTLYIFVSLVFPAIILIIVFESMILLILRQKNTLQNDDQRPWIAKNKVNGRKNNIQLLGNPIQQ